MERKRFKNTHIYKKYMALIDIFLNEIKKAQCQSYIIQQQQNNLSLPLSCA